MENRGGPADTLAVVQQQCSEWSGYLAAEVSAGVAGHAVQHDVGGSGVVQHVQSRHDEHLRGDCRPVQCGAGCTVVAGSSAGMWR